MGILLDYLSQILGGLAAVGAIASIYYLIQEMREQNRVARANARQNVADSHQEIALEGMKKSMVKIKLKLKNNEELTPEEDAKYMSYFSIMLRSRENQHYQYTIGMIDKGEWENYKRSFKTLFRSDFLISKSSLINGLLSSSNLPTIIFGALELLYKQFLIFASKKLLFSSTTNISCIPREKFLNLSFSIGQLIPTFNKCIPKSFALFSFIFNEAKQSKVSA